MPQRSLGRPAPGDIPEPFAGYVALAPEDDLLAALDAQTEVVVRAFADLPAEKIDFRYAPGKWTPREMFGHLIDTERVMAFRALWFARADPAPLPGFDENLWADHAGHAEVPLAELIDEFRAVRASTLHLLRHLPEAAAERRGVSNGRVAGVRALAAVILGHPRHHLRVLAERYLG